MRPRSVVSAWGRRRKILVCIAGAVALVGPLLPAAIAAAAVTTSPPLTYGGQAMEPNCSSDASKGMQAWLEAQAPDTTVELGGACYQIDAGVRLIEPQGLTIENGSFRDLKSTPGNTHGHGTARGQPVFDIVGGHAITFQNLTFTGLNRGGYNPHLAFQAAIELEGTIGASLSGLGISKVFGDGIDLEPLRGGDDHESGQIINPVEQLSIANVTIRGAGRQGITLASVNGASITNVTMTGIADDAFDFEADQNNEGAKNVVINGCSYSALLSIDMEGPETGPITVENCTMPEADTGWAVNIDNLKGKPDAGRITFDDDIFNCGASAFVACFQLDGATNLVVENSLATIGYPHDAIHEDAYSATNNTKASFLDDTVSGYNVAIGTASSNSSVTITGGRWSETPIGVTITTLSQSDDTVGYGLESADIFVVNVAGQLAMAPTGTVTIADSTTESPICIASLVPGFGSTSSGACTAAPAEFSAGLAFTTVTAIYYGDGNYADSGSSPAQSLTVEPGATTVTLEQSTSTVAYGSESADTFTTTVTPPAGGTAPSGPVIVDDAATSTPICTAILTPDPDASSTATCSPTDEQFPPGAAFKAVTAYYGGDGNYVGTVSSPAQSFAVVSGTTVTTLNQSGGTVAYGAESADTFTATVTPQGTGVAPSGTVAMADTATSTPICTATLVPNPNRTATATCSPTGAEFPAGTGFSTVTASYGGDGNYAGSASSLVQSFMVISGSTVTFLHQTTSTVSYGSEGADTFTAFVPGVHGVAPPTGLITVADTATATPICSATLVPNSGGFSMATCSPINVEFPTGTAFATVVATYAGNGNYGSSTSSLDRSLTVAPGATTTALDQTGSIVSYGAESADTFAATVTPQGTGVAPSGTVTMADTATATPICTATLVPNPDGLATATCSPTDEEFTPGTAFTTVTATYSGDLNYVGSASFPGQNFTAVAGPTATTLDQTESIVSYGSEGTDTFTATVTPQGTGVAPSGTVTVADTATATPICSATLVPNPDDSATATCSPTDEEFPPGTAFGTVTASYSGDQNYATSASSTWQYLTVLTGSTTTTLDQTESSVSYGSESTDTFTATVTPQGTGPAPSGTVSLDDAATMVNICTATLVPNPDGSATATCNPTDSQFPSGTALTTVAATYEGDDNYSGSVSTPPQSFTVM